MAPPSSYGPLKKRSSSPCCEVALDSATPLHELLQELVVDVVAGERLAHQLFGGLQVGEASLELGEVVETALEAAVLGGDLACADSWSSQKSAARMRSSSASMLGCQPGGVKDSSAAIPGGLRPP